MNTQLEKGVALENQVRPVGVKIFFDQLKGKNIVTRGNGGVCREDRFFDIVSAGRYKSFAR